MRVILIALLLVTVPLVAQEAKEQAPPLTPIEALRVENLRLESVIIQREVADWQAKRATLKQDLERERAGWIFHVETGAFTKAETK